MRIASIQAQAIDCGFQEQSLQTSRVASPMSRFARFGDRRASWMWPTKKAFIRVVADDGTVGWSCTNGGEVVALIVNEHLSKLVEMEPLDDLAVLWDQMFFSLLPVDRSGYAMMAVAGIDIALWDLMAKATGRPLVTTLGGNTRQHLPVYVTTTQPESHAGLPLRGLKAAAPYGPEAGEEGLAANVAYMRRFRAAAGDDVPIMVDAFMAWDVDYTLRFAEASRHLDLTWIEDPLPPYDLEGTRRLKAGLGDEVSLALGNFCFGRWDCVELLREGLVDVLQPDVAWAGGVTETLRILEMAEEHGTEVILHNTCEQPWALALAAARQTDAVVEFVDRGDASRLYDLMGDRAVVTHGQVAVPDDPAGNRPQRDIVARFPDTRVLATEQES